MQGNTKFWVVRAGEEIRDSVESGKFVAIDFGGAEIGDVSGLSREGIRTRIAQLSESLSPKQVSSRVGQLYRFTSEIEIGHVVLTPMEGRRILIGTVQSTCQFVSEPVMPYRRSVKWQKHVLRDDLSVALRNAFGLLTVFSLDPYADEIRRLLGEGPLPNVVPTTNSDLEAEGIDIFSAADIEVKARKQIEDLILGRGRFSGHEFEGLVAALLQAMGYKIVRGPLPGADGGVDVIVAPDQFGFQQPRIIVQVKHQADAVGAPDISQLQGRVGNSGKGLFVSTGGFTRDAKQMAGSDLTLLNGEQVVDYFIQYYEYLPSEYKAKVPLKLVYLPDPPEELAG